MPTHVSRPEPVVRQAIVLGASVAGLLAARALAPHFDRVLVLDRDSRPYPGHPRQGAPQGHHPHLLLQGGFRALEQMFPGLADETERDGVALLDFAQDVRWRQHGSWKTRFQSGVSAPAQTRPVLEERIRQRVAAMPNVRFAWRSAAVDLSFGPEPERVNGVWARLPDEGLVRVEAELVVDASGGGSRLPRWLAARGFEAPPEERDAIDLVYTTGLFRRRSRAARDWRALLLPAEGRKGRAARGGMVLAIDPIYLQVSLHGYGGEEPPTSLEGFTDYAGSLPCGDIRPVLEEAILVSGLERFAVPAQIRRRYESLRRFPAGLLVIGDAACRLDPAYAQGMTVAALQAQALSAVLARRKRRGAPTAVLANEYFARAARIVDLPWRMSGAAARIAQQSGRERGAAGQLWRWYRRELALAAAEVPAAHRAMLETWHLVAQESRLFRPWLVATVLANAARRRRLGVANRTPKHRPLHETSGALRLATASEVSGEIRLS
jgi:2-polyprenyl-6-methoxyphenol hydroxylase-like FAD-dependent oxidoreductase